MPVPLIIWGVAALGAGFAGGALSRQSEVNKLHNEIDRLHLEIEKLQKEVQRLQMLVEEQDRQIKTLIMKYHTMKGIHIIQKSKAKKQAKGAIMYTYCLKEYLDIKNNVLTKDYIPTDEEDAFIKAFSLVLEGELKSSPEDIAKKHYIRLYIRNKFGDKIDALEECQLQNTFNRIGVAV